MWVEGVGRGGLSCSEQECKLVPGGAPMVGLRIQGFESGLGYLGFRIYGVGV